MEELIYELYVKYKTFITLVKKDFIERLGNLLFTTNNNDK